MIEMDFYDLFYSLGIIGFIAYIGSFLFILLKTAMAFLKNIKLIFEPNYIFILVAFCTRTGHFVYGRTCFDCSIRQYLLWCDSRPFIC